MESTTYMVAGQEFELQHYGVKGMKWGVRRARGHGGLGSYATRKRQLAGDKRDLEGLNKGRHLSYGLTKKRQAALDARDKVALEKRIAKNSERQRVKDEKKSRLERAADAAQRDSDNLRKHGYKAEADAVQKVADKNRFKADVKDFKKNGFNIDYEIDSTTGQFTITQYRNSKNQVISEDYADRILAEHNKQSVRKARATTAGILGAAVVYAMLAANS